MHASLMLLFSMATSSVGFSPVPQFSTTRSASSSSNLHMSSPVKVPITISGDNIDLTPALSDYVNQKVDRTLGKLSSVSAVSHCDVYLTVNKNPKVNNDVLCSVITKGAVMNGIPRRIEVIEEIFKQLTSLIYLYSYFFCIGWGWSHCRGCYNTKGYYIPCRWKFPWHVCFYWSGF